MLLRAMPPAVIVSGPVTPAPGGPAPGASIAGHPGLRPRWYAGLGAASSPLDPSRTTAAPRRGPAAGRPGSADLLRPEPLGPVASSRTDPQAGTALVAGPGAAAVGSAEAPGAGPSGESRTAPRRSGLAPQSRTLSSSAGDRRAAGPSAPADFGSAGMGDRGAAGTGAARAARHDLPANRGDRDPRASRSGPAPGPAGGRGGAVRGAPAGDAAAGGEDRHSAGRAGAKAVGEITAQTPVPRSGRAETGPGAERDLGPKGGSAARGESGPSAGPAAVRVDPVDPARLGVPAGVPPDPNDQLKLVAAQVKSLLPAVPREPAGRPRAAAVPAPESQRLSSGGIADAGSGGRVAAAGGAGPSVRIDIGRLEIRTRAAAPRPAMPVRRSPPPLPHVIDPGLRFRGRRGEW